MIAAVPINRSIVTLKWLNTGYEQINHQHRIYTWLLDFAHRMPKQSFSEHTYIHACMHASMHRYIHTLHYITLYTLLFILLHYIHTHTAFTVNTYIEREGFQVELTGRRPLGRGIIWCRWSLDASARVWWGRPSVLGSAVPVISGYIYIYMLEKKNICLYCNYIYIL